MGQWTKPEIRRVEAMFLDGLTLVEIAERLGRTHMSVCMMASISRLNLRQRWREKVERVIIESVAAGESDEQIASKLRRSANWAGKMRRELGLRRSARPRRWTLAEERQVIAMGARGISVYEIAAEMGRTVASVRAKRAKLRKESDRACWRRD